MFTQRASRLPTVLVVWIALLASPLWAIALTVTDLKGRSIAIELISLAGNSADHLKETTEQRRSREKIDNLGDP